MDNAKTTILLDKLDDFIMRFSKINKNICKGINSSNESEKTLIEYTDFILDAENRVIWEECIDLECSENKQRIINAQRESAHCVWTMEKYRAMNLISSGDSPADYFKNVEECIEDEFGGFLIDNNSRVLLIGVGAFPMTPLLIAKKTGAKVVGIDIDTEAIEYANKVINLLGQDLNIEVSTQRYDCLEFTKEATHIILASTIPEKFDILCDLYTITNKDVVVSMRYGNGFKSLFNYPLLDVPGEMWKKVESTSSEDNVFDIALYAK